MSNTKISQAEMQRHMLASERDAINKVIVRLVREADEVRCALGADGAGIADSLDEAVRVLAHTSNTLDAFSNQPTGGNDD